jgi:hypothetical protein
MADVFGADVLRYPDARGMCRYTLNRARALDGSRIALSDRCYRTSGAHGWASRAGGVGRLAIHSVTRARWHCRLVYQLVHPPF